MQTTWPHGDVEVAELESFCCFEASTQLGFNRLKVTPNEVMVDLQRAAVADEAHEYDNAEVYRRHSYADGQLLLKNEVLVVPVAFPPRVFIKVGCDYGWTPLSSHIKYRNFLPGFAVQTLGFMGFTESDASEVETRIAQEKVVRRYGRRVIDLLNGRGAKFTYGQKTNYEAIGF